MVSFIVKSLFLPRLKSESSVAAWPLAPMATAVLRISPKPMRTSAADPTGELSEPRPMNVKIADSPGFPINGILRSPISALAESASAILISNSAVFDSTKDAATVMRSATVIFGIFARPLGVRAARSIFINSWIPSTLPMLFKSPEGDIAAVATPSESRMRRSSIFKPTAVKTLPGGLKLKREGGHWRITREGTGS